MKRENPKVYDMKHTHQFHSQLRPQTNQIKQDQKNGKPRTHSADN